MAGDQKRTEVALIEYQSDFTADGGAPRGAVEGAIVQPRSMRA
ncbi:MAG: hypothetical protein ACLP22_15195 [Solirubrobacteraceae bacterium]